MVEMMEVVYGSNKSGIRPIDIISKKDPMRFGPQCIVLIWSIGNERPIGLQIHQIRKQQHF